MIIGHSVRLRLRFTLELQVIQDLLAERGITVCHETIRRWVIHFGPIYVRRLWSTAVCRHLTAAGTYRILRGHAFDTWKTAVATSC